VTGTGRPAALFGLSPRSQDGRHRGTRGYADAGPADRHRCRTAYVYTGNVHDERGGSTWCPSCKAPLVLRDWYRIDDYRLRPDGCCPDCGTRGRRFENFKGAFARRIPIAIHRP